MRLTCTSSRANSSTADASRGSVSATGSHPYGAQDSRVMGLATIASDLIGKGDHFVMDVRNIENVAPVVEHNGTVPVWWMVNSREMKEATEGGFLELVNEFEVEGGGYGDPHSHPTHEFYYVLRGRGIM